MGRDNLRDLRGAGGDERHDNMVRERGTRVTHRNVDWPTIMASYEAGTPLARLAQVYGLTYTVVRENLVKRGVVMRRVGRPRKPTP